MNNVVTDLGSSYHENRKIYDISCHIVKFVTSSLCRRNPHKIKTQMGQVHSYTIPQFIRDMDGK